LRLGIRLTALKADIFDAIKSRGSHFIKASEIASQIGHRGPEITIRSHVTQINDLLEETDWRIEGLRGKDGGFRLVKRRVA
jgi:hypothetical protein